MTFLLSHLDIHILWGWTEKNRTGPSGRTWRVVRRPTTDNVSLRVPRKEVTKFCKRHGYGDLARKTGRYRAQFLVTSDVATVLAYNSEFRGFANYHSLADDIKSALGLLELVVFRSLVKTLAMRHQRRPREPWHVCGMGRTTRLAL